MPSRPNHDRALWLYRRFRSPKTIILDEDSKEEKEIDRFEPVKMLADALQGYTAQATDKESGIDRCVKAASRWHIQAGKALDGSPTTENFLGERDLIRRLSGMNDCHESICKYIASWESPHQSFYAMEFMPDGSLLNFANDRLHNADPPISNAVRLRVVSRIMSRIVDSMEWLHSKCILHMDLSLENILMADMDPRSPKIKIIDFGAALDFSDGKYLAWTHDRWLGKKGYRVLEVAENDSEKVAKRGYRIPYDAKSADIGTLGGILWCLLCGYYPPEDLQGIAYGGGLTEWIFSNGHQSRFDRDSLNLLNRLWTPEDNRITMEQLVRHPFIIRYHPKTQPSQSSSSSSTSTTETQDPMDVDIPVRLNEMARIPTEIISSEDDDDDDDDDDPDESCEGQPTHEPIFILSRQKTTH